MIRLSMMRGDTTNLFVTLTDADEMALDLDDVEAITFTAKLDYDDSADTGTTIVKTLGDGIVIDGYPEAGTCMITIDPADTEAFAYSYRLNWDIQVVGDAEQDVRTVARGWLFVYRDMRVPA